MVTHHSTPAGTTVCGCHEVVNLQKILKKVQTNWHTVYRINTVLTSAAILPKYFNSKVTRHVLCHKWCFIEFYYLKNFSSVSVKEREIDNAGDTKRITMREKQQSSEVFRWEQYNRVLASLNASFAEGIWFCNTCLSPNMDTFVIWNGDRHLRTETT